MNVWQRWWEQGIHKMFVGKPLEELSLERFKNKWWDKIKMGVNTVNCAGMN